MHKGWIAIEFGSSNTSGFKATKEEAVNWARKFLHDSNKNIQIEILHLEGCVKRAEVPIEFVGYHDERQEILDLKD